MRKLMEYKIISGRQVEIKRTYLSVRLPGEGKKKRGTRKAGSSTEKKLKRNEQEAAKEFARTIAVNFQPGDGFFSLKYDEGHLPGALPHGDFTKAKGVANKFRDKFRKAYKKEHGRNPKTILVNANWSPKNKRPARVHHHLLVPADGIELARRLWESFGGVGTASYTGLDSSGDYSNLASYLIENLERIPNEKHWHPSRNLDKPIYTEPVPVEDVEGIQAEKGSVIKAHEKSTDEDGHVVGTYLRCVLPEKARVRGGQIYLTRRKKG